VDDLVQWYGAQLDADAAPIAMPGWHEGYCMDPSVLNNDGTCFYCGGKEDPANVYYQERPSQVLRDIGAKRAVLARYEFACKEAADLRLTEEERELRVQVAGALQSCVCCLAVVYDDRAGYRKSWRP